MAKSIILGNPSVEGRRDNLFPITSTLLFGASIL
jgi:hypothetical protein